MLVEVAACVGHVGLVGQPHLLDVHLDAQRRIGHIAHTGTDAVDRSHVASIEGIACWQAHECRHAVASIAIAAVAVEAGYEPRAGAGDVLLPIDVSLPMVVELIAQLAVEAGVAGRDAAPRQVVDVAAYHERQLVVQGGEVGSLQVLGEASPLGRILAKARHDRGRQLDVEPLVQPIVVGAHHLLGHHRDGTPQRVGLRHERHGDRQEEKYDQFPHLRAKITGIIETAKFFHRFLRILCLIKKRLYFVNNAENVP